MNYNEISKQAHTNSVKHGFWREKLSDEHCLMLICTEVAEMIEADRKNDYAGNCQKEVLNDLNVGEAYEDVFKSYIKDTVEDEMADTYIRLGDLAGHCGIDFDKMQPCRYFRAYDKFTFTENAFALVKGLCKEQISLPKRIQFGMDYVEKWAAYLGVNLAYFVEAKMKYNENREMMHSKKY